MIGKGQDVGWISAQFGKSVLSLKPNSSYSSHQPVNPRVSSITRARQRKTENSTSRHWQRAGLAPQPSAEKRAFPRLTGSSGTAVVSLVAQTAKNPPANAGDTGFIPGSRRSPGEGNGNPLQHSCLGNPMDRGEPGRLQIMGSKTSQTRLGN